MNTKNYKKVENLFEGVSKHVKTSRSLIEKPYVIEEFGDKIFIREQVMMTLDDGIEVERCFWSEADLSLCDDRLYSMPFNSSTPILYYNKDMFDKSGNEDFLKYLESKGFFLENVEDNSGRKWKYCGIIDNLEFYRIQYFREDDYYDE